MFALSQRRQSTASITSPHRMSSSLWHAPLFPACKHSAAGPTAKVKTVLAEVGGLVTSLVTRPQTVLSRPHNHLRTTVSISKLPHTLDPLTFCFFLKKTKSFWNFLGFFPWMLTNIEEMLKSSVELYREDWTRSQGTRALDVSLTT